MANFMHKICKVRHIVNKRLEGREEMASRKEIGEKIRSARKDLGYTQKTVSEKSGVHKTTISEMENGHFTGSFDLFEKVLNSVKLQFEVVPKKHKFPHWDEIKSLFQEDD